MLAGQAQTMSRRCCRTTSLLTGDRLDRVVSYSMVLAVETREMRHVIQDAAMASTC